jgi:hypothetical protein
MTDLIEPTSD